MTLYGWDKSHYDGVGGNKRAVSEGFRYITHKAGGDGPDHELGDWWADAKKISPADCLLGAYWVLYPGHPVRRANQFIARLDRLCHGWRDRPFILQVDCERWRGKASTLPPLADVRAFCDRLSDAMPKLRPIVYGPKWCYGHRLAGLGYPLWASSYVKGTGAASKLYPGDHSRRWNAYSGTVPAILQFTSRATIARQTTCDANAFRGSLAQLTTLVAPGWAPPPSFKAVAGAAPVRPKEKDMELDDKVGSKAYAGRTIGNVLNDLEGVRDHLIGDPVGTKFSAVRSGSPLARLLAVPDQVDTLGRSLSAAINALGSKDQIDEAALAGLLAPGVAAIVVEQVTATLVADDVESAISTAELSERVTQAVHDALASVDSDEITALQREVMQNQITATDDDDADDEDLAEDV